jgi:hypothetical protein
VSEERPVVVAVLSVLDAAERFGLVKLGEHASGVVFQADDWPTKMRAITQPRRWSRRSRATTDHACGVVVELCAFSEREVCPETICNQCLRIQLGQSMVHPHVRGG